MKIPDWLTFTRAAIPVAAAGIAIAAWGGNLYLDVKMKPRDEADLEQARLIGEIQRIEKVCAVMEKEHGVPYSDCILLQYKMKGEEPPSGEDP